MPDLNLGVIGNSSVAALIDRRGRIVWYCLPRFDGDPVFCSLLNGEDPPEGFAEILLENLASASQEYLGNTSVLVTTLTDSHGATLRITDFVPRFKQYDRIFRPAMLIRRVDVVSGLPAIRIRIRPTGDHGRVRPTRTRGSNHIRYLAAGFGAPSHHRRADLLYRDRIRLRADDADQSGARARRIRASWPRTSGARLPGADDRLLDRVDALSLRALRMAGGGDPRRDHLEALPFRGDGRHGGGAHHLDPRGRGYRAQLGLSRLLDARCLSLGPGAEPPRRDQDDGRLPRLHQHHRRPRGRSRPEAGLRHHPRHPPDRGQGDEPRRLSRHGSGQDRQSGPGAGSERFLRQHHPGRGADVLRPPPAGARRSRSADPPRTAGPEGRGRRLPPRCGHLGISRPPGGPYPFGDALLGGLRPPGQDRRQPRPAGARAALAAAKPIASARPFSSKAGIRRSAAS